MTFRIFSLLLGMILPMISYAGELTGTASYRERIALPAEARFQAVLFDISNNRQVEIGRFEAPGDAGPPYRFVIDFDDGTVNEDGLYSLQTEIIWPDRAYVAAGMLLDGFPQTNTDVDLVMVRPGVLPATGALSPMTTDALQGIASIAAHGLDLPASYQGVVSGNGGDETWQLTLGDDQSFQLARQFEDGMQRATLGRWQADPTNDQMILRDGAEMPLVIAASRQSEIKVIDANTTLELEGSLNRLDKTTDIALENMTLGGMMTYMADAAVFVECISGLRFPIAQEGDYLALERAYLADRTAPGAPLYVMLEGSIVQRPAMEGPDRPSVVVDRFIRTRGDTTCERQQADASLRNTYWKLEQINGAEVSVVENRIEPHLVLEAGEEQNYRATVGCNRMRGGFELDGEALTFGAAASTMMACPEPLDSLERQLGSVLAEVTSFAIEGETLILRDAAGDGRAMFRAVYF